MLPWEAYVLCVVSGLILGIVIEWLSDLDKGGWF
jgi:hypothetical protein